MLDYITDIHMKFWTDDAATKFAGYCTKLHERVDEQEQLLAIALTSMQSAVNAVHAKLLVEPPGEFTELTGADVAELQDAFYNR